MHFQLFQVLLTILIVQPTSTLFTAQNALAFIEFIKTAFLLFIKRKPIIANFLVHAFELKLVIVVSITKFAINVI